MFSCNVQTDSEKEHNKEEYRIFFTGIEEQCSRNCTIYFISFEKEFSIVIKYNRRLLYSQLSERYEYLKKLVRTVCLS